MSLAGRLEDLGVAEILYLVGIARRSGELVLDLAGRPARVLFRAGRVVAVRHPRGSASLGEMLVHAGVTDAARLASLERQASQSGGSWIKALQDEGRLPPGGVDRLLEPEVEGLLASLAETGAGSFHFRLLSDAAAVAAVGAYAGLVLSHGIDTTRLGGATARAGQGGLRGLGLALPRTSARRQAILLVPEERIALPHPRQEVHARRHADAAATHALSLAERERVALVVLSAGDLRQALTTQLAARGLEVEVAETLHGAEQRLRGAVRDARACVIADATSATIPGIEILALSRTLDLGVPVVVLLDATLPPSRRALLHERALRLGARHVALLDPRQRAGDEARRIAEDVADLLDHASAPPPAQESGVVRLAAEPSGPATWEELADSPPQGARVAARASSRSLLPSLDPSDVGREILEAAEAFPRAVLFVRLKDAVRGLAAHAPAGAKPDPAEILRTVVLPHDGEDFLSRALRDGRAVTGPPAYGPTDKGVLAKLGRAAQVALLPLSAGGTPIGLLYADDGGTGQPLDPTAMTAFLVDAAAPLHGALTAAGRRADARRSRLERVLRG